MLPNLGTLDLRPREEARTGEFIRLTRAQARKLNNDGYRCPINKTKYLPSDCEPSEEQDFNRTRRDDYECFEPFKVWIRDERTVDPDNDKSGRPGRQFNVYNAQALWDAVKYDADQRNELRDPATRQPFWREDWYDLQRRFDPDGAVPEDVRALPRKNKDEGYETEEDAPGSARARDQANQVALQEVQQMQQNSGALEDEWGRGPVLPIHGRFWLKGVLDPLGEREELESYLKRHFNAFLLDQHRRGAEFIRPELINVFDLSIDNIDLADDDDDLAPRMSVMVVDFRLRYDNLNNANAFLDFMDSLLDANLWHNVASDMFGIGPTLHVSEPHAGYPAYEIHTSQYYFYRSEVVRPTLTQAQFDSIETWRPRAYPLVPYASPPPPPINVWGRFWLKGDMTIPQREEMEDFYLRNHLQEYMQQHGIGTNYGGENVDVAADDISHYTFNVAVRDLSVRAWGPVDFLIAPMMATVIEFQLTFRSREKADAFLRWAGDMQIHTGWSSLAQEMFGIGPMLNVGMPQMVAPEDSDPDAATHFGAPFVIPSLGRANFANDTHWEILTPYGVPFSGMRGD